MLLREMRVTYSAIRHSKAERTLRTSREAGELATDLIGREVVECAIVLLLDVKHRLVCWHLIGRGTVNAAPTFPRDVFRAAIQANAVSVLYAHNHPSGHLVPSDEDRAIVRRLVAGGTLLGIEVLDCLIVGPEPGYYSAREMGELA